jgi:transcriptional regulator with XRE-family HTH domain
MAATPSRGALGALIRRRREELGRTQQELAEQLKLDATPAISRWEKGVSPVPPVHWKLLAKALDLSLKTIMAAAPPKDVKRFQLLEMRASKGLVTRRASESDLDSTLLRHPKLLQGFQRLHEQYPDFQLARLVDNACHDFLARALENGLDGHGMPLRPPGGDREPPSHPKGGRSDQQSGRPPYSQRIARSA